METKLQNMRNQYINLNSISINISKGSNYEHNGKCSSDKLINLNELCE